MKKPYTIAGKTFRTKKALREHIREILYANTAGQPLNSHDFEFMRALLEHHPGAAQKVGCGVVAIFVRQNLEYGNYCFWLRRTDGTETDFSFTVCLKAPTKLQIFKSACRSAVADTVIDLKKAYFHRGAVAKCPLTGEEMTIKTAHVDHAPPMTFDKIVMQFIEDQNLDVNSVKIQGVCEDQAILKEIADEGLREKFVSYHNSVANLRVISKGANLRLKS